MRKGNGREERGKTVGSGKWSKKWRRVQKKSRRERGALHH